MNKKLRRQRGKRRLLAWLLCLCMMMTMLPTGSVKAEEAESGSVNSAVTFETLEGTDGFMGDGQNVLFDGDSESYGALWFDGEAYVIWKASETLKVTGYSITVKKDNYQKNAPKSWTLYGARERLAKNVSGWTSLDRVEDDTFLSAEDNTTQNYELTNPSSNQYMYFMLKIDQVQDQDSLRLAEFTLKYETCDHVWESTDRTTAPDCTKPGANIWRCSTCGAEKEVEDPSNHPALGHHMVEGRCNRCGEIEKKRPQGEGTQESPYQIGEVSELYWFAGLVNGDKDVCTDGVTQDLEACAALTADITINKRVLDADGNLVSCTEGLMEWKPIDEDGYMYKHWEGTFDGQGHCIRGLYCDDSQLQYAGLFGYMGGTVTRVGVEDAYMAGKYTGGICGYCFYGTIKNCYVIGTMTGVNSAGGLAGENSGGSYATSYSIARNAGSSKGLSAVGDDRVEKLTNCYYGPDDNGDLGAKYQSAEEFASGKVAYLLQDQQESGDVWGQKLNTDKYPVFDLAGDRKVYQTTGCITYSNNPEDQGREKEHGTWKDGTCQICGEVKKQTEKSVSYLDENGDEQSAENVEIVTDQLIQWNGTEETSSWYVIRGNRSIRKRITVSGDVHLILADGCSLQAESGIRVATGNALTIHAQSDGETAGKLVASGQGYNAGIGGDSSEAGGTITIRGGNVDASGETGAGIGGGFDGAGGTITIWGGNVDASSEGDGAGIGGGNRGGGGTITIHGGNVNASGWNGAGIGGGSDGAGGTITIRGGNVDASSEGDGAGIGGGSDGAGGTITIRGGNVNASGGDGAGIGGGDWGAGGTITIRGGNVKALGSRGAGIGGGSREAGGTITIWGGNVDASSNAGAGIGGGEYKQAEGQFQTQKEGETGSKGKAVIFASSISDMSGKTSTENPWSGLIVCDGEGGFYGDLKEAEISGTLSLLDGAKLTLKREEKLTIQSSGMIINYGTMTVNEAGSLVNEGTIINYGKLMIKSGGSFDNASGILQNKGSVTNENTEEAGTISGTVKKALTIKEITTETKEYDGTNRVKVTGVTLDGMDEGDEVEVPEEGIALSAIVYYPDPDENKPVKALEGSVSLAGKDADKYWVDLTCKNISWNNGEGVTITKNTEEVVRMVAVRNYLVNRSYSETIGFKDLLEKYGYDFEKKSVKLLDENGNEVQETEQCTVEVNYYGTLRYTINACKEGKRKLIVAVESDYYSNIQLVVDMTMVSGYKVQVKEGGKVTADPEGITYGQSLSELAFQDTVFTDENGNIVLGTLAWKDASAVPEVSETTAEWVFTPLNDAFASLEGKAEITVHKKKTQVKEAPEVKNKLTYGQKLSDAVLTGGSVVNEKGETISGIFEWMDPDQIPTAVESGKTKYKAVFVPEEENYSECETEIVVTVNKAAQASNMPETTMTVPYTTKTLEEITLPENWQWQTADSDQTSLLEVDEPFEATAEYVGSDKGNYETESVTIIITRSACTHETTELRNAKEATCTQDGYSGDTYCTICDTLVESGQTIPASGHKLTKVEAKEATAIEAGNLEYFKCDICGEYFEDGEGKAEITDKNRVVIPAKGTTPTKPTEPTTPTSPTTPDNSQAPTEAEKNPAENTTQPEKPATPKATGTVIAEEKSGVTYKVINNDSKNPEVEYTAPVNKETTKVVIPDTVTIDGVEYAVTSIAKSAFKNNKKLTEVKIGKNVTSIGDNAFAGCKNLRKVELNENLTTIGKHAFKNCKKLKTITIKSTKLNKKNVKKGAFKGITAKTVIKVPKSKLAAYKKLFRAKGLSKKVRFKKY